MGKIATFRALDRTARLAALEAAVELVKATVRVAHVPPQRWAVRFGPIAAGPALASAPAETRMVAEAIRRAIRNLPYTPLCLPQALAARTMLARRGIAADLYLGTQGGGGPGAGPRFHAWCKVAGEWVTGSCDEAAYALLVPAG